MREYNTFTKQEKRELIYGTTGVALGLLTSILLTLIVALFGGSILIAPVALFIFAVYLTLSVSGSLGRYQKQYGEDFTTR